MPIEFAHRLLHRASVTEATAANHPVLAGRDSDHSRSRRWLLSVLVWPLLLLWPFLGGQRVFLPYDLAQFPPASLLLPADELRAIHADSNFDITETPIWFVPELQRARRTLVDEHALPNWHPTARTGTALLPHGHDGILYPLVWPALFARDPATALGLVALLNLTIAGALMFGFLRALGLVPAAAAFGALALCASTTLAANAHNYSRLSSLVWLPGMLWGLRLAADAHGRRRWRALAGFAACFALTWIGGFPPYALPATALGCVYALLLWLQALRQNRRDGLRRGGPYAVAIALGAMAAAIYLLPAFAFFGQSARSLTPDLARISQVTFDRFGLLGYLANDLFGRPDLVDTLPYDRSPLPLLLGGRTEYGGRPLEPGFNATEYALFGGSLTLWLALLAIGNRHARHRWFPLLLLLLYWSMAAFVLPLGYLFLLPGIRVVPPLRFLGPCCALLAWLAAQGLDLALRRTNPHRLAAAIALALLTAGFGWWFAGRVVEPGAFADWHLAEHLAERYAPLVADPASFTKDAVERTILHAADGGDYVARGAELAAAAARRASGWHLAAALLLLGLLLLPRLPARMRPLLLGTALLATGIELYRAAQTFDRGIRRDHSDWTQVHDFLVGQRRATADQGGFMIGRAASASSNGVLPAPSALPPGTLGPYDIRDLQVYSFFDRRSADPVTALCQRIDAARGVDSAKGYVATCLPDDVRVLQHPLFDLLGLRYVLSTQPLLHAGTRTGPELRGPGGEFFVYERPSALPRAFVAGQLTVAANDDAVLQAITDPAFAPHATIYATRDDVGGRRLPAPEPAAAQRAVHFRRDHATAIDLAVDDGPAGWLLLADTWMPGWTATIDGRDAPVLRADHALRAVELPAGSCTVAFRYTPPGQRLGCALTALAGLLLAGLCWPFWSSRPGARRVDIPM